VLGLEADDAWRDTEGDPIPPAARPELAGEYEPPPAEPIEWTPERAAALVRGGGIVLHKADPLHHEPGGEDLWRATSEDADAIGAPLSRILNRYAPARELAGHADEAELALAVIGYTRDNLALRGRLVAQRRDREGEREVWLGDAGGNGTMGGAGAAGG
jgi:hypothetical protein